MLMILLHIRFHFPSPNGSLVTIMKWKAKYKLRAKVSHVKKGNYRNIVHIFRRFI